LTHFKPLRRRPNGLMVFFKKTVFLCRLT